MPSTMRPNGESNRDGMDQNLSWNCGVEGPHRGSGYRGGCANRQVKNFLALTLLSIGTPMLADGATRSGATQLGQ